MGRAPGPVRPRQGHAPCRLGRRPGDPVSWPTPAARRLRGPPPAPGASRLERSRRRGSCTSRCTRACTSIPSRPSAWQRGPRHDNVLTPFDELGVARSGRDSQFSANSGPKPLHLIAAPTRRAGDPRRARGRDSKSGGAVASSTASQSPRLLRVDSARERSRRSPATSPAQYLAVGPGAALCSRGPLGSTRGQSLYKRVESGFMLKLWLIKVLPFLGKYTDYAAACCGGCPQIRHSSGYGNHARRDRVQQGDDA